MQAMQKPILRLIVRYILSLRLSLNAHSLWVTLYLTSYTCFSELECINKQYEIDCKIKYNIYLK